MNIIFFIFLFLVIFYVFEKMGENFNYKKKMEISLLDKEFNIKKDGKNKYIICDNKSFYNMQYFLNYFINRFVGDINIEISKNNKTLFNSKYIVSINYKNEEFNLRFNHYLLNINKLNFLNKKRFILMLNEIIKEAIIVKKSQDNRIEIK